MLGEGGQPHLRQGRWSGWHALLLMTGLSHGCACPCDNARRPATTEPERLHRAQQPATTAPWDQPPVGALGLPLGTVAEVRATVVAGRDLGDKGHSAQYLLRV